MNGLVDYSNAVAVTIDPEDDVVQEAVEVFQEKIETYDEDQSPCNFNRQMSKSEKTILSILGGLVTTLVVYLTVRLWTGDAVFSIVPGWHTTIYPPELSWIILTIVLLVTSLFVHFVFRAAIKVLTTLWTRLKS